MKVKSETCLVFELEKGFHLGCEINFCFVLL